MGGSPEGLVAHASCMTRQVTALAHLDTHPVLSTELSTCADRTVAVACITRWQGLGGHGVGGRAAAVERVCFSLLHERLRGSSAS